MTETIELSDHPYEIDPRINSKFVKWRGKNHEQKKAVEFIITNPKRYVLLTMPTGSGKSLIAVTSGILTNGKTIIITRNTQLAKQYERDFKIPVVIGRSHYQCTLYPEATADSCPFTSKYSKCPAVRDILQYYDAKRLSDLDVEEVEDITCPYVRVRELAKRSDVCVLNYHYFYFAYLSERKWPKPELVIVDEAHEFPNFLINVSTTRFHYEGLWNVNKLVHETEVQKYFIRRKVDRGSINAWRKVNKNFRYLSKKKLGNITRDLFFLQKEGDNRVIPPEEFLEKTKSLKKYVEKAIAFSEALIAYMKTIEPGNSKIDEITMDTHSTEQFCEDVSKDEEIKYLCNIVKTVYPPALRVYNFIRIIEEKHAENDIIHDDLDITANHILYLHEGEIVFKPIYPHIVFEELDKRLGHPKWVFMSATLFPRFISKELAITGQYSWMEVPTEIPKEFRQVFYVPYAPMYRDYMDQKPFVREYIKSVIDEVLKTYNNEKGIILVVSKKDIQALETYSRYSDRFIEYSGNAADKKTAMKYHKAGKNTVLISVAWEGIDLVDELSRFQIIYQVPFLYLGDPVIKIRRRADREWYYLSALNKIIQGAGRSIRHKNDFAITFIFDSRLENMIKRYRSFVPAWFLESIKKYGSITDKSKFRTNLERSLRESREDFRKWQRLSAIEKMMPT